MFSSLQVLLGITLSLGVIKCLRIVLILGVTIRVCGGAA